MSDEETIAQRLANLEFRERLAARRVEKLEAELNELSVRLNILTQPRDVRYVRQGLRGR